MANRLSVQLVPGWTDISHENVDGPPTYLRETEGSGVFQISIQAEYVGGTQPNPSPEQLIDFAASSMTRAGTDVELRGRAHGQCAFGHYGTVLAYVDEVSWFQIWVISNGKDFILASHVCTEEPSEDEVNEVSWMVKNTRFAA